MARATEIRAELVKAFVFAVHGESRFGAREDVRPELDQRWMHVIELIQELATKPKSK